MSNLDIIRAWKDPQFRSTLAHIPAHPAGEIDLAGANLDGRAIFHPTDGEHCEFTAGRDCTGTTGMRLI